MEFKFDAHQEFQVRAIESVTDLLEGQTRIEVDLEFSLGSSYFASIPNRLNLDEATLLGNLQAVQANNGIRPDNDLQCVEASLETGAGTKIVRFPNFSVEMETGTGKTYVYIRTVLELFRRYGLRKFIVVVPSVAIQESVPAISKTSMAVSPAKAVLDTSIYFSFLFSNTSSAEGHTQRYSSIVVRSF